MPTATNDQELDELKPPNLLLWAQYLLSAVLIYCVVVAVAFRDQFWKQELATDVGTWGQAGDYFGGFLNPIIGLATVVLIFISIRIQQFELRESVRHIKLANAQNRIQSFEQSLFSWLANYHSLLDSIEYADARGRKAMSKLYAEKFCLGVAAKRDDTKAKQDFRRLMRSAVLTGSSFGQRRNWILDLRRQIKRSLEAYHQTYRDHRSDFDAAYRTMFRLLRWVDRAPLSPTQRWHYVALIRAQLSWIEMIYFFYNGMTKDGSAFAKLANKYALFDNLVPDSAPHIDFMRLSMRRGRPLPFKRYGYEDAWQYDDSAFDSAIAKRDLHIVEDASD